MAHQSISRRAISTCLERVNLEQRDKFANLMKAALSSAMRDSRARSAIGKIPILLLLEILSIPSAVVETGRSAKSGQIRSI